MGDDYTADERRRATAILDQSKKLLPWSPNVVTDKSRPWMIALEMQFAALRLAHDNRDVFSPHAGLTQTLTSAALFLRKAQTFAWSAETATAAMLAARTVPETATIQPAMLPNGARAVWWWFAEPLNLGAEPDLTIPYLDKKKIVAISIGVYDDDHLGIILYRSYMDDTNDRGFLMPFATTEFRVRPGCSLREVASAGHRVETWVEPAKKDMADRALDVLRFVAAACVWLQQRVLVCSSGHIERHRRKQLARDSHVDPPTDVQVIQLRRLEAGAGLTEDASSSGSVEWSCRWIVNGHWRNQPYKNERKLIYIMPHVKGPADAPLKIPAHTVYQVNR